MLNHGMCAGLGTYVHLPHQRALGQPAYAGCVSPKIPNSPKSQQTCLTRVVVAGGRCNSSKLIGLVSTRRKASRNSRRRFDPPHKLDRNKETRESQASTRTSFQSRGPLPVQAGLTVFEKESGKWKSTPVGALYKKTLRQYYDVLCNSFTYFSTRCVSHPGRRLTSNR